jgi:hypothetical protein
MIQWMVSTIALMGYVSFINSLLTAYSSYPSLTEAKVRLDDVEIFIEHQLIMVMFYAQTMEGIEISRVTKSRVDSYLEESRRGSSVLRSDHHLLLRAHTAGLTASDSVDEIEENLKQALFFTAHHMEALVDLHMAMLAQGVPHDIWLPDSDSNFVDDVAGESIPSIRLFLEKQKIITFILSTIINKSGHASRVDKRKAEFYLSEVALGTDKLERILERAIITGSTVDVAHCSAMVLSLKRFHISLLGQGVQVDFKPRARN